MNESLILEKLDSLTFEIRSLKADVLQEIRKDLEIVPRVSPSLQQPVSGTTANIGNEELIQLVQDLHQRLAGIDSLLFAVKAGVELTDDLGPVMKQALPKTVEFFADLDGQFDADALTVVIRNTLANLDNINEGINLLKMGVELRDEMIPVAQLAYPKVLKFLNALHEGEFQAEHLGTLLHTILINIHTLSDLLNMLKPVTELVKELQVVVRETDVISNMNQWLDGLQNSSGIVKLAGTAASALKRIDCNETQVEAICQAISGLDFSKIEPVSPLGMFKLLRDPKIQETLGAFAMIMRTAGTCLHAYQLEKRQQNGSLA